MCIRDSLGTGKQMSITITASTKLSQAEKDRMVKEAEMFAEQDKRAREEAEARNTADSLIYTTEKTLTELGDKITPDLKSRVQKAVDELKEALKNGGLQEINSKIEALRKTVQEVGASVYQQAAQQQASQGQATREGEQKEQDKKTVEAEYKVVDEEEKKK